MSIIIPEKKKRMIAKAAFQSGIQQKQLAEDFEIHPYTIGHYKKLYPEYEQKKFSVIKIPTDKMQEVINILNEFDVKYELAEKNHELVEYYESKIN